MSTFTAKKSSYHHGDLRGALIEVGLKTLETSDPADISLRQMARDAGVSATAVYRHFPDKRALLGALAHAGLTMLGDEQRAASRTAGGGSAGFAATGRAYVRFALAHPGLFRLIFTHAGKADGPELCDDNPAAVLLRAHADMLGEGDATEARRIMVHGWAIAHGLAMLILDGHLPADEALIEGTMPVAPGL